MKIGKEYKIGIFAVLVLVVSFFVINYLRGKDVFGKEMDLVSYYDDVEGLLTSCPVYVKGYKAGSVADIEYDAQQKNFKVTCSVLKSFRVPEDSKMVIYSVDIMGGKGVRIDFGESDIPARSAQVLEGGSEPDLISSLSSSLGPLMAKLQTAVDSLTVTVASVNGVLAGVDPQSIRRSVSHLEATLANADKVSEGIGRKSAELEAFIDNLKVFSDKLNGIADKTDGAMGKISSVAAKLDASDIEGLVGSFRALLEKLQDPDGTLGKLLSDDAVYTNIESLLADIDNLVNEVKNNPKKYIKITIF
ncbi:MAG: MlaD family protein [Candidatus Cryptobacteroides sp.]